MSTQPETGNDLDRTDELPQLDLAAYEAGLAGDDPDPLSRTDTWTVQALQVQATPDDDAAVDANAPAPRSPKAALSSSADVSLDVNRVLNRITELEAGIVAARTAQTEAQERYESLATERDTFKQQLVAVEASNARLSEQSTLSQELAQRLEQQLSQQSEQHRAQLAEIEAARAADQLAAQQGRAVLEREIEQNIANLASAAERHAQLEVTLGEALALAASRAERIEELQRALAEEQTVAYELSRNLAAKLMEHDALASKAAQRSTTISALERERDELGLQQQQSTAKANAEIERLTQQVQASIVQRDELAATVERLAAKDAELVDVRAQLVVAQNESAALRTELQTQSDQVQTMQADLAAAHQLAATQQNTRDDLQQALEEAQQQTLQLQTALTDNAALLNARDTELDAVRLQLERQITEIQSLEQSLHARDTLIETLRGEMRTAQEERTILANELNKVRSRMKAMAQQLFDADNHITTLKADLAVHTEALAAIRRDVEHAGDHSEALAAGRSERVLEPLNHESGPIVLNRRVMTLGRTEDNDICIPFKLISRHHARLLIGPNAVVVEDAGSTNGCFVNGHQVKQHVLHENDVLTLGDLKFRLRVRPAGSITRSRGNVIDFNKPG